MNSNSEAESQITAMLAFQDSALAMQFYTDAFGATELARLTEPGGKIAHAQMKIGNARLMLADENPEYNATPKTLSGTSVILHLYVENADAFVEKAVAAGARTLIPVKDQFYGDRSGRLMDPFGYIWIIASKKEDVSLEEMRKRFAALFA